MPVNVAVQLVSLRLRLFAYLSPIYALHSGGTRPPCGGLDSDVTHSFIMREACIEVAQVVKREMLNGQVLHRTAEAVGDLVWQYANALSRCRQGIQNKL